MAGGSPPFSSAIDSRCSSITSSSSRGHSDDTGSPDASSRLQRVLDDFRACLGRHGDQRLSAEEVAGLRQSLQAVPLEELGIKPPNDQSGIQSVDEAMLKLKLMNGSKRPAIKYLHVYEDSDVSVGIFCLPASATIPLHNHPGMTVFSRLLYGQLFVQSFDWCSNGHAALDHAAPPPPAAGRPARLVMSRVAASPDPPMVLFPTHGGNIHTFTALTDCAVLDVLSPPYDTKSGRDCTYYYVSGRGDAPAPPPAATAAAAYQAPPPPQQQRGAVLLSEFEPPDDFVVTRGLYTGVKPTGPRAPSPQDEAAMYHI